MLGLYPDGNVPVQLYHLHGDGQRTSITQPADHLEGLIHYYWWLEILESNYRLKIIPDAAVDVVFSGNLLNFSAVYLPSPKPWHLELEGPVSYFGICMPVEQAAHNLGHTMGELSKLIPGSKTTEALGLSLLSRGLNGESTLTEFATRCDQHFAPLVASQGEQEPEPLMRLHRLMRDLEYSQIARIADEWGISERQLRRLTTDWVGMSPKKIQNVQRLQITLAELLEGALSQRDDFYDDSHRIRELRRLTGLTPGEIRRMAEKYNAG